jgi:DNA-binding response OmpR family regulator
MADRIKKQTILLIDDDALLLHLLEKKIEVALNDTELICVDTGEKGFELAKEKKPDLILLDIMLPNANGWEIAERLRRDARTEKIPIIAMSGAHAFTKSMSLEEGLVDGFLPKPFDVEALLDEINEILEL